jgi:RNA polymerase sigma-70 factor (sigma-E family)
VPKYLRLYAQRGQPISRPPRRTGVQTVAALTPAYSSVGMPRTAEAAAAWDADEAVTQLYAAHYRSLVRLAALLLRDSAVAEEVVQDAFVGMHQNWRRIRDTDKALGYLRQSVVNGARSTLRRRAVAVKHMAREAPPGVAASAEHSVLASAERAEMMRALSALPLRQREALVLRYYVDLSEAEIAAAMGISRGAVKSHASRGLAALRAGLGDERR